MIPFRLGDERLPNCDRCFRNNQVSKAGYRLNKKGATQTYWCERCKHRFTLQTVEFGPIYYDRGKAHRETKGSILKWARVPEMDAKKIRAGA